MNKLYLTKEIYSLTDIQRACGDYCNLAQITIVTMEDKYQLTFEHCKYPMDLTMQEFENYLIDIMGKHGDNRIY